jgi:acyl dehydratase
VSALQELVGAELGPTSWLEVPQERIDAFAEATDDRQWIHVDPERAAAVSPFGSTVAHGFLTLSLCVPMLYEVLPPAGLAINYGVNRVRFPAPVRVGSRVRARFEVRGVEAVAGGEQAVIAACIECDGGDKPVCVAELVVRSYEALPRSVTGR